MTPALPPLLARRRDYSSTLWYTRNFDPLPAPEPTAKYATEFRDDLKVRLGWVKSDTLTRHVAVDEEPDFWHRPFVLSKLLFFSGNRRGDILSACSHAFEAEGRLPAAAQLRPCVPYVGPRQRRMRVDQCQWPVRGRIQLLAHGRNYSGELGGQAGRVESDRWYPISSEPKRNYERPGVRGLKSCLCILDQTLGLDRPLLGGDRDCLRTASVSAVTSTPTIRWSTLMSASGRSRSHSASVADGTNPDPINASTIARSPSFFVIRNRANYEYTVPYNSPSGSRYHAGFPRFYANFTVFFIG